MHVCTVCLLTIEWPPASLCLVQCQGYCHQCIDPYSPVAMLCCIPLLMCSVQDCSCSHVALTMLHMLLLHMKCIHA